VAIGDSWNSRGIKCLIRINGNEKRRFGIFRERSRRKLEPSGGKKGGVVQGEKISKFFTEKKFRGTYIRKKLKEG